MGPPVGRRRGGLWAGDRNINHGSPWTTRASEESRMSYRELSMIEVKEVLRRREAGQAWRETARETGLDRKTVRR